MPAFVGPTRSPCRPARTAHLLSRIPYEMAYHLQSTIGFEQSRHRAARDRHRVDPFHRLDPFRNRGRHHIHYAPSNSKASRQLSRSTSCRGLQRDDNTDRSPVFEAKQMLRLQLGALSVSVRASHRQLKDDFCCRLSLPLRVVASSVLLQPGVVLASLCGACSSLVLPRLTREPSTHRQQ